MAEHFEPSETGLYCEITGPEITESHFESIVRKSGAHLLGEPTNIGDRTIFPLQESHAYQVKGKTQTFHISTCGRTDPGNALAPLLDAIQPHDAWIAYFHGQPLVQQPRELSVDKFCTEYLRRCAHVEKHNIGDTTLFIAKIGKAPEPTLAYKVLRLHGCDPEVLEKIDRNPEYRAEIIEHLGMQQHRQHGFEPHGYTAAGFTSNGYVAFHTAPEHRFVSLHLYGETPKGVEKIFSPETVDGIEFDGPIAIPVHKKVEWKPFAPAIINI